MKDHYGLIALMLAAQDDHLNAVKRVFGAARNQGIATGHHGFQINDIISLAKMGSMLCQIGSDISFMTEQARLNIDTFKNSIK